MAPDIVDTIRDLYERLTAPPEPVTRVISRQEWQDMAFPDIETGYAPGSIGEEIDRMETAINEASRQVASVFGISMAEAADQIRLMRDDGRFNWQHAADGLWGSNYKPPDPDRDKRAKELLLSLLDDKQRAMYQQYGCFVAVGNETGDHYLIYTANNYNVYNISTGYRYCAVSATYVPFCDMLASQLLMIECEEEAFWGVANRGNNYQHTYLSSAVIELPESVAKKLVADAPKREQPKPTPVTRAPRIGEPRVYAPDPVRMGRYMAVEAFGPAMVREPPRPIRVTVSGPCTPGNYSLIQGLRQSRYCVGVEETGALNDERMDVGFTAYLTVDSMFELDAIVQNLRTYEGLTIEADQSTGNYQQFPEDQGWQDCTDPDCPTCREYRRQNSVPRPVYHPAFLPPYRDPRSLLSHLNEIRTVSREVAGYGSTYDRPELREVMSFFEIPLSLEHVVIRWAEECLP